MEKETPNKDILDHAQLYIIARDLNFVWICSLTTELPRAYRLILSL